ncbi:MAG: REP element-mobilizing transposase RayT, partial [Candidatus Azotimanducaceae bacterium]
MTYPRAHLLDPNGGTYHITSRCVRRAYLCGINPDNGDNFDHRRQWIEDRVHLLSKIFAIDLLGYAVMSNHYHLILTIDPARVSSWNDETVVEKWRSLFPKQNDSRASTFKNQPQSVEFDTEKMATLRERLGSLSWVMRCLNEPIARLANNEDECKGRFWEGRFKSQLILDEVSLLACMVYVDLNPMRANIATRVSDAHHTSARKRTLETNIDAHLVSFNRPDVLVGSGYSLREYLSLLEWTLEAQQSIRPTRAYPKALQKKTVALEPKVWLSHLPHPGKWQRALGRRHALRAYAKS